MAQIIIKYSLLIVLSQKMCSAVLIFCWDFAELAKNSSEMEYLIITTVALIIHSQLWCWAVLKQFWVELIVEKYCYLALKLEFAVWKSEPVQSCFSLCGIEDFYFRLDFYHNYRKTTQMIRLLKTLDMLQSKNCLI